MKHQLFYIYFNVGRIKMTQYLTNILQCDTSIDDMKFNIDHWVHSFEKLHKSILLCQQSHTIIHFLKRVDISQLDHCQVSLIKKTRDDVISMRPSNCSTEIFFLDN